MKAFIDAVCQACKLHFWEWDLSSNLFEDFGFFDPLSHPDKSFDTFVQKIHPADRANIKELFQQHRDNYIPFEKAFRIQRANTYKWVFLRGQLLEEKGKQRMCGLLLGINAWKQNEETNHSHQLELMRLMKINSTNEIISLLAHELTQPLMVAKTYVSGCLYRLNENRIDNTQLTSIMDKVNHHISLVGEKIHEMKNYISQSRIEYRESDIHEVIQESLSLLSYELQTNGIQVNFDFKANPPTIKMDKIQIKQVLFNLMKNSIEAICKNTNRRQSVLLVKTRNNDARSIKVFIQDNGKGIPKNLQDKLFTSDLKNSHQGLKMGLSICRTIIEAHGGTLSAKSLRNGSNFQFTLHN